MERTRLARGGVRATSPNGTLHPGGNLVHHSYSARGELATVGLDDQRLAWYAYDMTGRRTAKTLKNNTGEYRAYDPLGRVVTIEHRSPTGTLLALNSTYDAVGNRLSKTFTGSAAPASAEFYAYDPIDQLVSAVYRPNPGTGSPRSVAYEYDPLGNRVRVTDDGITTSYTANALNQYTRISDPVRTITPVHDFNGNVSALSRTSRYTHNAENRLVRAVVDGVETIFAHDPSGRVVTRTVNGVATHLIYDGWSLIEERSATGGLNRSYVHGAELDELLVQRDATGVHYYHQDAVGSTVVLTNAAGAAIESYTYDAFGAVQGYNPATGTVVPESAFKTRFLFTGREYLPSARLYDYRHRTYCPTLGRFLQTDPIRFDAGDGNLYRYVGNNPVNGIDPLGLWAGWASGEEVSTGESFVPIWGSGRQAVNDFSEGRYVWGSVNTVMAVSDIFLIKTVATIGAKGAWKAGSATWGATRKWFGKKGYAKAGQHVHHGVIPRGGWGKSVPDVIKNNPFNLKPLDPPSGVSMDAWHKMVEGKLPGLNPAERWWHGTPDWLRYAEISGAGRIGNAMRGDDADDCK